MISQSAIDIQRPTNFGRRAAHALLAMMLILTGCGTWLRNPGSSDDDEKKENPVSPMASEQGSVTLRFAARETTSATLVGLTVPVLDKSGADAGTLTLTRAELALRDIRLRVDEGDSERRDEFTGPYRVNLLDGSMTPEPGAIALHTADYRTLELKLHKLEDEDLSSVGISENDSIAGRSIFFMGSYQPSDQSPSVDFTMAFEFDEEFQIAMGANPFSVKAHAENPLLVAFDLGQWLDFSDPEHNSEQVDFSDLGTGSILLDENSDDLGKEVRRVIKENVKKAAEVSKEESEE